MKTFLKVLVSLLLLATLRSTAHAQFNYETNNGTITITGYTGPSGGDAVIPETINGLPVTTIGYWAFGSLYETSFITVTIPDTVTNIANDAFRSCYNLTQVTFGHSVQSIGTTAFFDCRSLTNLALPDSLSSIDDSAFWQCQGLRSVNFGTNLSTIGCSAFEDCISLTSATLPNTLTSIPCQLFWGCTALSSVTMGTNVGSIGDRAFAGCTKLTNIAIPDTVTNIEANAFASCGLTSVTVPRSVTSIGTGAFGCVDLQAIIVEPENPAYSSREGVLMNKDQTALLQFPGGQGGSYTVPDTTTSIEAAAFDGNTLLTNAVIGNRVTNIASSAFAFCPNLSSVTFGNSLATISSSAFYVCRRLSSVTLPATLRYIGESAFYGCTCLQGVFLQGNAPDEYGKPFEYADNATIYYLPGTTGWNATFAGRPTALWNPVVETGDPWFGAHADGFGLPITGTADIPIVLEAAASLNGGTWIPLQSCTLTNGSVYLTDPQWTSYAARSYRIRSP